MEAIDGALPRIEVRSKNRRRAHHGWRDGVRVFGWAGMVEGPTAESELAVMQSASRYGLPT
jgi:hypothetical protein